MPYMNWLVFGVGAIGTYVGGCLELSRSKERVVTFIDRPEVVAQVKARGMYLDLPGHNWAIPFPPVTDSLSAALDATPFDAAILALKSYDTQAFLDGLGELADRLPPVLCLQNGVENEAMLEARLGKERVIPGTVTSAVRRVDAGKIVLERLRGIGVAETRPLSRRIVQELDDAYLEPRLYPNPLDMKWSKLLTNLLANASSAILNMTPAEIFADRRLFRLERQQLREALAVMAKLGVKVVNLPGTPVRWLAFAVRSLPAFLSRPLLHKAVGGGRGGKMPSLHIDLYASRRQSEVDYLNGAVVRFGERVGIPTPVNRLLNETLLALARGEVPLETFARQPERLLEQIG